VNTRALLAPTTAAHAATSADVLLLERIVDAAARGDAGAAEVLRRARDWSDSPSAVAIVAFERSDAGARRLAGHVAYYLSHASTGRPVPMGPATVAAMAARAEGGGSR
jgi:hypothetical protein